MLHGKPIPSQRQVVCEDRVVYEEHGRLTEHADGKRVKVTLQSGIYSKGSRRWIHAGHKLTVFDDAKRVPVAIVPMAVVHELANDLMRLYRSETIHFGHVEVVGEVHDAFVAAGSVGLAGLFLQRFFEGLMVETSLYHQTLYNCIRK